jgi:hypothetical protein
LSTSESCANCSAAEETEYAQSHDIPGETCTNRAREENSGRDFHDDNAPAAISERTSEPGTDCGAQKSAGHGEAKQPGDRTGPDPYGINRAIDDSGIEAEKEPTHRG